MDQSTFLPPGGHWQCPETPLVVNSCQCPSGIWSRSALTILQCAGQPVLRNLAIEENTAGIKLEGGKERWSEGEAAFPFECVTQVHQAEHLRGSLGNANSLGQPAEQMAHGILLSPLFLYTFDEEWWPASGSWLPFILSVMEHHPRTLCGQRDLMCNQG